MLDNIVAQRNGYTFLGWSMSRALKDRIKAGDVNKLDGSTTLYAMRQPNVYELFVKLNGGTMSQENWFNFNAYAKKY